MLPSFDVVGSKKPDLRAKHASEWMLSVMNKKFGL